MLKNKLNNQSKQLVNVIWLLTGALLFIMGQALYGELGEFRITNIFSSKKTFAFIVYIPLAITFWAMGWRRINNNRGSYAQQLHKKREALGSISIVVRAALGLSLFVLPTALMLFQLVDTLDLIGILLLVPRN